MIKKLKKLEKLGIGNIKINLLINLHTYLSHIKKGDSTTELYDQLTYDDIGYIRKLNLTYGFFILYRSQENIRNAKLSKITPFGRKVLKILEES